MDVQGRSADDRKVIKLHCPQMKPLIFRCNLIPALALILLSLAGCGVSTWNDPYPAEDAGQNILYSSFAEKPKHLDPVQSYSSNEIVFTAQIYEPPLQYHYLKRPYTLIPGAAEALPQSWFLDARGRRLPPTAVAAEIAFTVYEIRIKRGVL
jgi:hypothetical protein